MNSYDSYPPLIDYGLIGDCHTAALVTRSGSIDWCCLPHFDSDSCFGRLLDRRRGGHFSITPRGLNRVRRSYIGDSLILVTTFECEGGEARLIDFFAMRRGGRERPRRELIRMVEGIRGSPVFDVEVVPRLDYGEIKPWIERVGRDAHFAMGSNTGLLIFGDVPLEAGDGHRLRAEFRSVAGERRHLALQFIEPHELETIRSPSAKSPRTLDRHYEESRRWWDRWAARITLDGYAGSERDAMVRSAIVLKALSYAPTGAIIAAPTTSLPEEVGGERNWDYRYSWLRDAAFTVHSLADLGCAEEADGFRRFVQRSAAGSADELQAIYGIDGKHSLPELELPHLEGWSGSRPVRRGNAAAKQFQGDMYGLLLDLSWRWSKRGNSPAASYVRFLVELVEAAIAGWREPDHGIWEIRSSPRHFVHSKVMCWAAVDRGLELAEAHELTAETERWRDARAEMREAILREGIDGSRGNFTQCFGGTEVDAALLLLPYVGFVDYDDERMRRTTDAIIRDLLHDGLVLRYRTEDGLRGHEGVFLPCSFWLAECLARQGRESEARQVFDRASGCANDLGLYSEEYSPELRAMLGNFPQGLTHLAHISAAMALHDAAAR